jgi:hypothetical protein
LMRYAFIHELHPSVRALYRGSNFWGSLQDTLGATVLVGKLHNYFSKTKNCDLFEGLMTQANQTVISSNVFLMNSKPASRPSSGWNWTP